MVMISVTEVLDQHIIVHHELTFDHLNSLCYFLMLELLKHLSPKGFSNTVFSLSIFF